MEEGPPTSLEKHLVLSCDSIKVYIILNIPCSIVKHGREGKTGQASCEHGL